MSERQDVQSQLDLFETPMKDHGPLNDHYLEAWGLLPLIKEICFGLEGGVIDLIPQSY